MFGNGHLPCKFCIHIFTNYFNKYNILFYNSYRDEETDLDEISIENNNSKRRVLKGGSFLDARDGLNSIYRKSLKIRISARIGEDENYSAQNVGFRCAQTLKPEEETYDFEENENYKVFRLRAPVHHHSDETKSHNIFSDHDQTEL